MRRECKKRGISDYDKGSKDIFRIISKEKEIETARQRAKALNENTKKSADPSWTMPYQWNPYTDVYKLLDDIDKFGEKHINEKPK